VESEMLKVFEHRSYRILLGCTSLHDCIPPSWVHQSSKLRRVTAAKLRISERMNIQHRFTYLFFPKTRFRFPIFTFHKSAFRVNCSRFRYVLYKIALISEHLAFSAIFSNVSVHDGWLEVKNIAGG